MEQPLQLLQHLALLTLGLVLSMQWHVLLHRIAWAGTERPLPMLLLTLLLPWRQCWGLK
jgi:hypothetical protein